MELTCEYCKESFESKNKNKRFCSIRCQNKAMWSNPEYVEKMKKKNKEVANRPENKERIKKQWSNLEFREKMVKIRKEVANRPEVKENFTKKIKEYASSDTAREKMSRFQKEYQNLPEIKEKNRQRAFKMWTDEHKERMSIVHMKRWKNIEWVEETRKMHGAYYRFVLPSGKIVKIQGYEPVVLEQLLQEYDENDIYIGVKEIFNEIGKIAYMQDGKAHSYYPDFYIKSTNTIIEVKSTWTYEMWKERNELKKQACINAGFNFKFIILTNANIKYRI